jgi:hypothetical protein
LFKHTLYLPTFAGEAKKLVWEDLVPIHLQKDDPLAELAVEEQDEINWIIYLYENLPAEVDPENQKFHDELANGIIVFREKGINLDEVIARRDKLNNTVVTELNNVEVSLAGYLLPLEMKEQVATEFLLVPYVGACIHVPPPLNQIVYVRTRDKKGYSSEKLFNPVLVRGTMHSKSTVKDLYLTDGTSDITIGYSLDAVNIEPYEGYEQ